MGVGGVFLFVCLFFVYKLNWSHELCNMVPSVAWQSIRLKFIFAYGRLKEVTKELETAKAKVIELYPFDSYTSAETSACASFPSGFDGQCFVTYMTAFSLLFALLSPFNMPVFV